MLNNGLAKRKLNNSHAAGYLGIKKFHLMMLAASIDAVQMIAMSIIDKLITGNVIGPDALAGISLLSPVDTILMLFEFLFSTGAAVMYTRAIADYDSERARKIEGMTILLTLIMGVVLIVLSFIGERAYFDMIEASGPARAYAQKYFFFSRFSFLLSPVSTLLGEFVMVDGDERLVLWTTVFDVLGDLVLSLGLCFIMGIGGASLGSIIGSSCSVIVLTIHFFRKSNPNKPIMYFSLRDIWEIIKIGASDSISLIFDTGYELFIKIWFISHFSMSMLPVLAAVSSVSDLLFVADGASDSINAMILAYRGDGNQYAIKNLMSDAAKISIYIAIGFVTVVCAVSGVIPYIFGIRDPELIHLSAVGCRIQSIEILPYIFIAIFTSYYIGIEKYGLAICASALKALIIRMPMVMLGTVLLGMNGVWLGSGLTSYVTLVVMAVIVIVRYGKKNFPFIDIDTSVKALNLSFNISAEEAVEASKSVARFLEEAGIDPITTNRTVFAMEEIPLLVLDINKDVDKVKERGIHIDTFTALEKEGVRLVLWYDGELSDATDPDLVPTNLRGFMVSGIMSDTSDRNYLMTSGYNRVSLVIPYQN